MSLARYNFPPWTDSLDQGDIIYPCPLPIIVNNNDGEGDNGFTLGLKKEDHRVVVLTQACDFKKTPLITKVVVCPVKSIVSEPTENPPEIYIHPNKMDSLKKGRIFGQYYLEKADTYLRNDPIPESVVDLRQAYTIPRKLLEFLISDGNRKYSLGMLFREHLSMSFAYNYFRIGLPEE